MLSAIGFHINKTHGGKSRSFDVAVRDIAAVTDLDMRPCAQIFVTGPKSNKLTVSRADKAALAAVAKSCRLVIHGAYIDNPWSTCSQYSIDNICAEMRVAAEIGATGVVVHLSNATNTGLEAVLSALKAGMAGPVTPHPRPILWLETHATKRSAASFETPAKLGALFARVHKWIADQADEPNFAVGLTIDSAHLHACGTDLRAYGPTMTWLEQTAAAVAPAQIMVHLNDSATALGSGVDKHAPLTQGTIWGEYGAAGGLPVEQSGLMAILDWADDVGATVILEREVGISDDLALIARLGHFS